MGGKNLPDAEKLQCTLIKAGGYSLIGRGRWQHQLLGTVYTFKVQNVSAVELVYNVIKGTKYSVSLQTSVVITGSTMLLLIVRN
jgi:hypothetical protein